MEVRSLGYRTDLALLRLGGSELEDRGDCMVVRTPHNPTFWWGNFLLLADVPAADETDGWLERFAEAATVMTAASVHEPPRPNRDATYRRLTSDDDWAQSVDLRVACRGDDNPDVAAYRTFATRQVATNRRLADDGHGGWFGAFIDGQILCQMGLFAASPGLARFQSVETHPDARGRGLAGSLVHHVSQYGLTALGAQTLVMVADPDYVAARVYRSVGFIDGETQLQAERPPSQT